MSRVFVVGACAIACGCGDNFVPVAPALAHSDVLFLVAHQDDDMIFIEPALLDALANHSTTTVYSTTAGPDGSDHHLFEAAKVAYGTRVGSLAWDCGMITIGAVSAQHCRLRDRPVSLVDLGLPDGGIPGDRRDSLLHLFDGTTAESITDAGNTVTAASVVDTFVQLFTATTPDTLQTLELAGSHGRDHSSHMFVASAGLWAAATLRFTGDATWHRGYNVDIEASNIGIKLGQARKMLGYYEACADHCGPCGESCGDVLAAHETWIERQYASTRVRTAAGALRLDASCLQDSLELGDCATAAAVELDADGSLRIGGRCVASTEAGGLDLVECSATSEQYWVLDSQGFVWNGRRPQVAPDMTFDHVRCLGADGAATCGAHLQPLWHLDS